MADQLPTWDPDKEDDLEPVNTEVTVENVLNTLASMAFFDSRRISTSGGRLRSLNQLDKTTATALVGLDVDAHGRILKYRFANRDVALKMLGQFLKMFEGELKDHGTLDALLEEFKKRFAQLGGKQ